MQRLAGSVQLPVTGKAVTANKGCRERVGGHHTCSAAPSAAGQTISKTEDIREAAHRRGDIPIESDEVYRCHQVLQPFTELCMP